MIAGSSVIVGRELPNSSRSKVRGDVDYVELLCGKPPRIIGDHITGIPTPISFRSGGSPLEEVLGCDRVYRSIGKDYCTDGLEDYSRTTSTEGCALQRLQYI